MGILKDKKTQWENKTLSGIKGNLSGTDSREYLVEGAQLMCINGNAVGQLRIPKGHGYTSGGRKKANCLDCREAENIPYFGTCRKNEKDGVCEGFMELEETWENTAVTTTKAESVDGEEAVSMSSLLLCRKGGIIMPITSGQGYDETVDWEAFAKRYANAYQWALGKNMTCQIFGKDPINLNTGNYIYEKRALAINGTAPLSFRMFYNAMDGRGRGTLGEGWNHNYEITLEEKPGKNLVGIVMDDGREILYVKTPDGAYKAAEGDTGRLEPLNDGYFYSTKTGKSFCFDRDGHLLSIVLKRGGSIRLRYDETGKLICAENETGRLRYSYNQEGRLIRVSDHTDRTVEIGYQYGRLRWYTDAEGIRCEYCYNENGKLCEIRKAGAVLRNEYDGADRILRQIMPDGKIAELRYDDQDHRTYLKEENGNMLSFESDGRHRNIKTKSIDGEEQFEYNEHNFLTLYTDRNGNTTRYAYDDKGNMTKITDAAGNTMHMTYDGMGRLIRMKYPDGTDRKYVYNADNDLTELSDRLGNKTIIKYGADHKICELIQPDGSRIRIQYDGLGNISHLTDEEGFQTGYTYDRLGRPETASDGNGNVTRYVYDKNDRIVQIINACGESMRYEYNESGKPVKIEDFAGNTHKLEYDVCGRYKTYTDPEGNVTSYAYQETGKLMRKTLPNGGAYTYTYTHMGYPETVTDPMGSATSFAYDAVGNCTAVIRPDGSETRYAYDNLNRLISSTEADGLQTFYEYDTDDRVTCIRDNHGNRAVMEYDAMGRPVKSVDTYGNTALAEYDAMGRMICKTDGAGRATRYRYNRLGLLERVDHHDKTSECFWYDGNRNVVRTENQDGFAVEFVYDRLNRLTGIRDSMGREKAYAYDSAGRRTAFTDANGNRTAYAYTPNGYLQKITDAAGNETCYEYDCMGNVISAMRKGKERSEISGYERDLLGRIVTAVNPLGVPETYAYDDGGNMTEKTDRDGNRTRYRYSAAGLLEQIEYADGRRVRFTRDSQRRLCRVEDWTGAMEFEWDICRRLKAVTDHKGRRTGYEFDPMGNLTRLTYPDGRTVRYSYDDCLRLSGLSGDGFDVKYRYRNGMLREKIISSGLRTAYSYDAAGQLTELINYNGERAVDCLRYAYDGAGNKTGVQRTRSGMQEESGYFEYEYDPLRRLTGVRKDGRYLREYGYDEFDNRISMAEGDKVTRYQYNENNELIRKTGSDGDVAEYTYDARGNRVSVMRNGSSGRQYAFGADNRLRTVYDKGELLGTYEYNGLGHRISAVSFGQPSAEGKETEYITDVTGSGNNLLQKLEQGVCEDYIRDGGIVGSVSGYAVKMHFTDELGSTIRTCYQNGRECGVYGYDEFGRTGHGEEPLFGFTGYCRDAVSDTYHAQAREYDPSTGRFLSEDTVHDIAFLPQTWNHYTYCWNDPCGWTDRNGLFGQKEANEFMIDHMMDEYRKGYEAWKDDISETMNDIGKQVSDGASDVIAEINERGKQIGDNASDMITKANEVWNNDVFGVNQNLYKEKSGDRETAETVLSVDRHTGGGIIVENKDEFGRYSGWSFAPVKIGLGKYNAVGYSESHKGLLINGKIYVKGNTPDGRISESAGYGIDQYGIYKNASFTVNMGDLPLVLPNGETIDSYTDVSMTYSVTQNVKTWDEVKEVVVVATAIIGYCTGGLAPALESGFTGCPLW